MDTNALIKAIASVHFTLTEKKTLDNNFARYVDPELPDNSYANIVDVTGDGHCGFRALSYQVYKDEGMYMEVKKQMRDVLLANYDQYVAAFGPTLDMESGKMRVCSGLERVIGSNVTKAHESGTDKWMQSPECVQVAADTFQRPVVVYPSAEYNGYAMTYLPVFKNKAVKPFPGATPLPIVLQNVSGNHWFTFDMKRSIKVKWPVISAAHTAAMTRLGHKDDMIKSFWNRHLTFNKHPDNVQTRKFLMLYSMLYFN